MGSQAAMVEAALERNLLEAAKVVEGQLDQQMKRMDEMGEDDLERIRNKRLADMKKMQQQKLDWKAAGHGEYSELGGERDFFEAAKKSPQMVCHFYDNGSRQCDTMHERLELLARKHMETRFVRMLGSRAQFLVKRLNIRILPTLALVKNGKTGDYVRGSTDPNDTTSQHLQYDWLEQRLAETGLVTAPVAPPKPRLLAAGDAKSIRTGPADSDDENDW